MVAHVACYLVPGRMLLMTWLTQDDADLSELRGHAAVPLVTVLDCKHCTYWELRKCSMCYEAGHVPEPMY